MDISVVIPTFNRLDNLKLVLAALEAQRDPPAFEVIIADDGSTDGTREFFTAYDDSEKPFDLIYLWCGPNLGFRTPRTRNLGVAQANAQSVLLLDSDVLLQPEALVLYNEARVAFPDVVIVGLYHWAEHGRPTYEEILESFEHVDKLVPDRVSAAPPVPGTDSRQSAFHDELDMGNIIFEYDGLGFLSGNILWPVPIWWALRGQNEQMPNGVGEDAEIGQRLRIGRCLIPRLAQGMPFIEAIKSCIPDRSPQSAIPVFQYAPPYGVHLHHKRNVRRRQKLVQESIAFIDRLYGIGTYAELTDPATDPREKDLSIWYTKVQEAKLVKKADDPTVYAIDASGKNYVGLATPDWFNLLGFDPSEVEMVEDGFFDDMIYQGAIRK